MSGRYLTDLAAVCQRANPTRLVQESGWQTRARSSGGYASGRPTHVMVHHTASNPSTDGQADVSYCCYSSENRPVANLYLSRKGEIWVMAAGCTNTNGQGHDSWGGGVPDDSMNTYALGIEAANTGVGEPWAQVQQDVYVRLVQVLCSAYGIPNNHVRAHVEWAPGRKIDPAGQSQWASGSATWDMGGFRSTCAGSVPEPEPTPPTPDVEDDEMADFLATVLFDSGKVNYFLVTSRGYRAVSSGVMNNMGQEAGKAPPANDVLDWYNWNQASWDAYVATRGLKAV